MFALALLPAFHSGGEHAKPQPDDGRAEVHFHFTSRFDAAWQAQLFYPARRCNRHSPARPLEPQSGPIPVSLQTDTGKYIGRVGNTGVDASKTGVQWDSQFAAEPSHPEGLPDRFGAIALRGDTGKYLAPTSDFKALDLSAASASPLVCVPRENDRIALHVPSSRASGLYISRQGDTGIGLASPAGPSAHVQAHYDPPGPGQYFYDIYAPDDPCLQFAVHYLHPFWSDKKCVETPREVSFYVNTNDGCSRGHRIDKGYAKLFRYDGDEAKLRIRALIEWDVWFYAFDTDAHLHIDVLRTKADRPWDATGDQDSSTEVTKTVPLVSTDWAHMPSRGPGGWGTFHKSGTDHILEVILDAVPGESVWLRAEAFLWWPEFTWLQSRRGGESQMQGRVYHCIKDIELSWEK